MSTEQMTNVTATSPPQSPKRPRDIEAPDEEEKEQTHWSWVVTMFRREEQSDPDSTNPIPSLTVGGMTASKCEAQIKVNKAVLNFDGDKSEVYYSIEQGKQAKVDLEEYPMDLPDDCEEETEAPPTKRAKDQLHSYVATVHQLGDDFQFTEYLSIGGFQPTEEAAKEKMAEWILDELQILLSDGCYPDWEEKVGEQKEGETRYAYLERFKEANLCFGYNPFVDHLDFLGQFFWCVQEGDKAEVDLEW